MTVSFRDFHGATVPLEAPFSHGAAPSPANLPPTTSDTPDRAASPADLAGGRTAGGLYRRVFKRLFDIAAVLAAAPLWVPVTALLAVLVATDGHAPFYCQRRVGRGGRIFRMWKLRSMVPDADARLETHLAADPEARAEWERSQKLRRDPRITPAGRILRKTSLDELPQLWNVLAGDMSIVGPRPIMVGQRALYPGTAYYRHRPGITGAWQVADRNESSFVERATFDAEYDRTLSFRADLSILWRTVGAVVRGTGC